MSAASKPTMMKMDGYLIGREVYVLETDARKHIQAALAMNGNSTLLAMLKDVIDHYDRYGCARIDSVIERARTLVNSAHT